MHHEDLGGSPGSDGVHRQGFNNDMEDEKAAMVATRAADDDATAVTAMSSAPLGREVVDVRDARDLMNALMKG